MRSRLSPSGEVISCPGAFKGSFQARAPTFRIKTLVTARKFPDVHAASRLHCVQDCESSTCPPLSPRLPANFRPETDTS